MFMTGDHNESGFTVIEVLIAAVIGLAVMTLIALTLMGSSQLTVSSKVKSRMASAAEQVYETMREDTAWTAKCETVTSRCSVADQIDMQRLEDDSFGPGFAFDVIALATPVDSPGDGTGINDTDGQTPDWYNVEITITIPQSDRARLNYDKPFLYTSSMTPNGAIATGSLVVHLCQVDNQVDERMTLSECHSESSIRMAACPDACGGFTAIANNPAHKSNSSPYVSFGPTSAIKVSLSAGGNIKQQRINGGRSVLFNDVPVGRHRITVAPPNGYRLWTKQSQPSSQWVDVSLKKQSNAMMVVRPEVEMAPIRIQHFRRVTIANWIPGSTPEKHLPSPAPVCESSVTDIVGITLSLTSCAQVVDYMTKHYYTFSKHTETWGGAGAAGKAYMEPQPRGRALQLNRAENKELPYMLESNFTKRDRHYGNVDRGGKVLEQHLLQSTEGDRHAGAFSGIMHAYDGGKRISATSNIPNFETSIWVDPTTGYVNGVANPYIRYTYRGECYVSSSGVAGNLNEAQTSCGHFRWKGREYAIGNARSILYRSCIRTEKFKSDEWVFGGYGGGTGGYVPDGQESTCNDFNPPLLCAGIATNCQAADAIPLGAYSYTASATQQGTTATVTATVPARSYSPGIGG